MFAFRCSHDSLDEDSSELLDSLEDDSSDDDGSELLKLEELLAQAKNSVAPDSPTLDGGPKPGDGQKHPVGQGAYKTQVKSQ